MRPTAFPISIVLAFATSGCTAQNADVVDTPTLQAELARGGVQLVDVRTPQEWSTGHIEGALHIDWFDDGFAKEAAELDREKPVRLYCAAGGRSAEAREMLRGMQFKDVKDLDGGIEAWKEAGAPVVR